MKISLVTAYYNRKELFINTLLSLSNSCIKDFEVIAVDDGSSEENRLEDIQAKFNFLKIIRIEPQDKWYVNPCIPFNIGFQAAKGEIVIFQNPECLHYGDILKYVADNLNPSDYISFASYSLNKSITEELNASNITSLESLSIPFLPKKIEYDGELGWYNHSLYKPRGFHWCSAIYRIDLIELGGFDEQFALGVGFDDDELLRRVKKKAMNFRIIDNPFVLHQNHFESNLNSNKHVNPFYNRKDAKFLWAKNEYLLNHYTLKTNSWKIKKKSRKEIQFFDYLLTQKLKMYNLYISFLKRGKHKLSRVLNFKDSFI
jgi:glycosyltransferase involved in cell wall biosynthesis